MGVLKFSYQAEDDGFDSTVFCVDWLIIFVCGLKSDSIFFLIKSFDRRVVVIDDCDDHPAIIGDGGFLTDYVIAVINAIVFHAGALDFKGKGVFVGGKV